MIKLDIIIFMEYLRILQFKDNTFDNSYTIESRFCTESGKSITSLGIQPLVYLPQICNMNTEAMNNKDITRTGTGPLKNYKRDH
jgi:hypothetical protein